MLARTPLAIFQGMDSQKAALKVRVIGRVQGVGFRYFTERVAEELGIAGYVMNCHDGSVEVIAEAERKALDEFLGQLKKGPRGGRVERVEETWAPYTGRFSGFTVRFSER